LTFLVLLVQASEPGEAGLLLADLEPEVVQVFALELEERLVYAVQHLQEDAFEVEPALTKLH
jgi:hypothetical protein